MLRNLSNILVTLLTWMCIIIITCLTTIVFLQVLARYFEFPLAGTEELSRFLMVWLTFIGSSLALNEKIHLAVDYFVRLLDFKLQIKINILVNLLMIAFFVILGIYGISLSMLSMNTSSPALNLPMGIVYAVIPISSFFSIFFLVNHLINVLKEGGDS